MSITLSTSARDVLANAVSDLIDVGGAGNLQIYTDGWSTLLAELAFSNPAFGNASNGVCTANTITQDLSANANGTMGVFQFLNGEGSPILSGTVSASGGDINFDSVTVIQGDTIRIDSMTITVPVS